MRTLSLFIVFAFSIFIYSCKNMNNESPKISTNIVVDTFFGTPVPDPYRWLEDENSQETAQWIDSQNTITQNYLANIPFKEEIKQRLTELWDYPKTGAPFKKGNFWYVFHNDGLQNQSILYKGTKPGAKDFVVLDPNKLSEDGTVALGTISFSKDGKFIGYSISRSGSDWQEIYVLDIETNKRTTDSLRWVKFSDITWYKNGFYYSRYDAPKEGENLSGTNEYMKVFYHKLGTNQSTDELIYENKNDKREGFSVGITDDEKFLAIYGRIGASSGNSVYIKNLSTKSEFFTLIAGYENKSYVIDNDKNNLLIFTNHNAPNYKVVSIDPANSNPANWKTIIEEKQEMVLQNVGLASNKLLATYMKDAYNVAYLLERDGKLKEEIKLPGYGTVSGLSGEKNSSDVYYIYTSFIYPPTVFHYQIDNKNNTIFSEPKVNFNPDHYVSQQVFFSSKDGTKVPMFIVHRKDLSKEKTHPTLLYGYGGFNISLNPSFSISRLALMEQGAVFALVNLRGGGEYGEKWHKAGMLDKKQNVFDDFIGAAEYLIKEGYTSSNQLGIQGGSNGGLLVGAAITQRPELFKVALPAVGVMDMLRFHRFTIGHAWINEYGCADSSEAEFKNLYAYSPLHNLKDDVLYPSTMVTTADHDDRVVPAHSFKFAATLQEKGKKGNPYLIRIDKKAGHGAGKPTAKIIEEYTDLWSFFLFETKK